LIDLLIALLIDLSDNPTTDRLIHQHWVTLFF